MLDMIKSASNADYSYVEHQGLGDWIEADKYNDYKRELKSFEQGGGFSQLEKNHKDVYKIVYKHFGID